MRSRRDLIGLMATLLRHCGGAAAVEMGLVAPLLAGFVIPVVDLGMGAYRQMKIESAAEGGAEYALLHSGQTWNQTAVQNAATNATSLTGVTATASEGYYCPSGTALGSAVAQGTVCGDGTTAGTFVTVSTSVSYTMLLSYPGLSDPLTLNGLAILRVQ